MGRKPVTCAARSVGSALSHRMLYGAPGSPYSASGPILVGTAGRAQRPLSGQQNGSMAIGESECGYEAPGSPYSALEGRRVPTTHPESAKAHQRPLERLYVHVTIREG